LITTTSPERVEEVGRPLVCRAPFLGEEHQSRPLEVRVRRKPDDAVALKVVDELLHGLTGQAHVAGDVSDRQRHRGMIPRPVP
jgi:hypothetical protein